MSYLTRRTLQTLLLLTTSLGADTAFAYDFPLGPLPISLKTMSVPEVPGLTDGNNPIVVDKQAAIALGKALFWDTNVGSDGMACGSCHFHAGADGRVKNQLSPGGNSQSAAERKFDASRDGGNLGPNRSLKSSDFPLHQHQPPLEGNSPVSYSTDNVIGSSGSFSGEFKSASRQGSANDTCTRTIDTDFHIGAVGGRRVTPRNAPTVINAAFNHRSFWDGRANNVFNGSSPWGDRDPDVGVWVKQTNGSVAKQRLHLINSSLASLAVAPPLNTTEMSCNNRSFAEIGRKLLQRKPLENQNVHYNDSVLGPLSLSSANALKPGLNTTYKKLIQEAFDPIYWSSRKKINQVQVGVNNASYNQLEANFSMFFGLAIQLYESTLISDESPFDKSARDNADQPIDLSPSELHGLEQFRVNMCHLCHIGPNFTAASVNANTQLNKTHPRAFGEPSYQISTTNNVIERIPVVARNKAVTTFYDTGFASTGVAEEIVDVGLGGTDVFGNPLSFSKQYLQHLAGRSEKVLDEDVTKVRACDFQEEFAVNFEPAYIHNSMFTPKGGIQPQSVGQGTDNCFLNPQTNAFLPTTEAALAELNNPNTEKMIADVNASFKIPSLRNIELTGPYMHNGGLASLEQVLQFYARGGNFSNDAKQLTRVFPLQELQFSEQNRADLLAFLKTLTDDRVRYEKAPFDHPEIKIPHGHVGDSSSLTDGNPLGAKLAKDEILLVPAVGANGSSTPIKSFETTLGQ